ncbi:MAG: hypothetical protein IJZ46_05735 [Bacilli bacterium]|nr:hypothetical protein [Bacilli bacterium]
MSVKNKIGEKSTTKLGMNMSIIQYYNCNNISVQFDDGTIVNTTYANFKQGNVKY